MSRVILLCADHPLPLYAAQTRRVYFHRGVRYEEEDFLFSPMSTTALRWTTWSCP